MPPTEGLSDLLNECITIWEMISVMRAHFVEPSQLQSLEAKILGKVDGFSMYARKLASLE